MANETDQLGTDIAHIRGEIERLRDEVRVRLHLGAMDARDAFAKIEHDIDHVGREISQSARGALNSALDRLKKVSDAIKTPPASGTA